MNKRNHTSAVDARRELVLAGYVTAFSSPGRPECWGRTGGVKQRYAIAREDRQRSKRWHIVDYPGSPVCNPETLAGIVDVIIPRGQQGSGWSGGAEFAYLE